MISGHFIKEDYIHSFKAEGFSAGDINNCIKHPYIRNYHKGYIWKKSQSKNRFNSITPCVYRDQSKENNSHFRGKIQQYSLSREFIKEVYSWEFVKEGFNLNSICFCINHPNKQSKHSNYMWRRDSSTNVQKTIPPYKKKPHGNLRENNPAYKKKMLKLLINNS